MDHVICIGAWFPRPHPRPILEVWVWEREGRVGRVGGIQEDPPPLWTKQVGGTQRRWRCSDQPCVSAIDPRGGRGRGRGSAACKSKPRSSGTSETKVGG